VVAARAGGYAEEMDRIAREIGALGESALASPVDTERATRYVSYLYQQASLAGDLQALAAVDGTIGRAIALLPNPGDLYLLKANLAFKLHRLDGVRSALEADPYAFESLEGRALRADLDFQHGRYEAARSGYAEILQRERTWDNLARMAHFTAKLGGDAEADQLYAIAEDELTAKEMRQYAWIEVQRGFLHFTHGRYIEARSCYQRAERAYPGYWVVADYTAELLGAEGRYDEATAIYERIVAAAPKPDLEQAVGELYALMDEPHRAEWWHKKALAGYLESAGRGDVHYYHHLVDYYSDVAEDGPQAVHWARQDLALRENFSTQGALAWALHRDGRHGEALEWIGRALTSGTGEARLYYYAAEICAAAAPYAEAKRYRKRVAEINPRVEHFHVHH
jgi:tetratricopeptide (TPR) repeat protein